MENPITEKPIVSTPQTSPVKPIIPASTLLPTEPQALKLDPPKHISRKTLLLRVIGLMLGVLVLFILGVLILQPRAYLWVVSRVASPNIITSTTQVDVERTFTSIGADPATQSTPAQHDTIKIVYQASHIAPDSWAYSTKMQSSNEQIAQGDFEARLFGKDAFQRDSSTATAAFTSYTMTDAEYASTQKIINASSFFQKGFLDFLKNPTFVFKSEGQPFWMLHYRFEIPVADLEAKKPDWYAKEAFPFSSDETIPGEKISLFVDVWINPFTGKVTHEKWRVKKEGEEPTIGKMTLFVLLDRSLAYPTKLTIDRPQTK